MDYAREFSADSVKRDNVVSGTPLMEDIVACRTD
jgi:hypothetical protein